MIVVVALGVAVDAIGNRQVAPALRTTERRTETDAIDSGAAVAMVDVAVDFSIAVHVGGEVLDDFRKIDGAKDLVPARLDADSVETLHVDHGNVEGLVLAVFE